MKLFGYNFFPAKIKVDVTMKSGDKFFFYCDKWTFKFNHGFTFVGGLNKFGSQLPGYGITVDTNSIESIKQKKIRLYRIYKL